MPKKVKVISQDEPWCFPEPPDRSRRWCAPESPPRIPPADEDEPWCFPDDLPHTDRKRRRSRSWPA
jgi:hypothetical protein